MADKWPAANGNWSTAANWNGGTLPVDGDDIYMDGKTITLDQDINLPTARILTTQRTGGTTGGVLNVTTSRSITVAAVVAGGSSALSIVTGGTTVNLTGATCTGSSSATGNAVSLGTATLNATNCTFVGGNLSTNRHGLGITGAWASITFTNCTARGGPGGNGVNVASSISGSASGTLNLVNDAASTVPALNIASGSFVLSGNVSHQGSNQTAAVSGNASLQYTCTTQTFTLPITTNSSTGLWNFSTTATSNTISSPSVTLPNSGPLALVRWGSSAAGKVTYTGDIAMGNSSFNPITITSSSAGGVVKHVGTITGPTAAVSAGVALEGSTWLSTCEVVLDRVAPGSSNNIPNIAALCRFETTAQLTVQTEAGVNHVIAATAAILDMPAPSNVRSGTSYNLGTQTGTCAVPPAGSVAFGVPVDATTGTAVLSGGGGSSDWTADEKTAIRAILGVPTSGTTPTDPTTGILDAIRDKVVPLPSDPADASDIASAFGTVNSTLGTIAGYIDTEITDIRNRLPAALVGGRMDASVGGYQAGQAPLQPAVAGRSIYLNAGGQVSSEGDLDAAEIRGALGLGGADLDTQLGEIKLDTETLLNRITAGVATLFTNLIAMITGSGASAKWTTVAMSNAPTGGGGGGGGTGTGARTVAITVQLSGAPVEGATVRLTKAAETYVGQTDVAGQITFNVDDGTWTVGITSAGLTFGGASLVVDGNETQTYSLTAISITPSSPGYVTGYWLCLGANGAIEAGATISMQAYRAPGSGLAMDATIRQATSGVDGVAQFSNLIPGAVYQVWRGTSTQKKYIQIPEDAESPLELNSIIGSP